MIQLDLSLYLVVALSLGVGIFWNFLQSKNNTKIPQWVLKYGTVVYLVPPIASLVHFLFTNPNALVFPIYASSLIWPASYFIRHKTFVRIPLILVLLTLSSFQFYLPQLIAPGEDANLQNYASLSYTEAFDHLHMDIQSSYPLTEYKKIDFASLYATYYPKIQQAEQSQDPEAYYLSLHEYIKSFPDGHFVSASFETLFTGKDRFDPIKRKFIGGSYGFTFLELDNGDVIVSSISPKSAAESVGLEVGDRLVSKNGIEIKAFVSSLLTTWASSNIATKEFLERIQYALATRDPIGTISVFEVRKKSGVTVTISLEAFADDMVDLNNDLKTYYHLSDTENLTPEILLGKHGYIVLTDMQPKNFDEAEQQFENILEGFIAQGVDDLILDLRNNSGGSDRFAARLLSHLTDTEIFYLQEKTLSEQGELVDGEIIWTFPSETPFLKPIYILVNSLTVSAGEGFVYNAAKLPHVQIVGMTGTNGSFLTIAGATLMPDNILVMYPSIMCVDENGDVLIDSDDTLSGGIKPDMSIPLDANAVMKMYADGVDYELEYLLEQIESQ